MKNIILIFMLSLYSIVYSQNLSMQENSSNIRGHGLVQYGTKECGIVFLSEKMYSLHSKGMNLCDNYSKKFYLENIPIDNEDLVSLNLRRNELYQDGCLFVQKGECDSNAIVIFYVRLSIPICIEGVEYSYQDTIPTEYLNGDKLHFRRERRFLRKDRIIVEKEEKIE